VEVLVTVTVTVTVTLMVTVTVTLDYPREVSMNHHLILVMMVEKVPSGILVKNRIRQMKYGIHWD
jgi:hypothetical protein